MAESDDWIIVTSAPRDPDNPDWEVPTLSPDKNTWQDAENIDATHGYISYIWIPAETHSVRVMRAHVWAEKFRAYSTGAAAGGGQVITSGAKGSHRHEVLRWVSNTPVPRPTRVYHMHNSAYVPIDVEIATESAVNLYCWQTTGSHTHSVTLPNHTHNIAYGIYEEGIVGRTLSAALYDKDGVLLHNFGVILTGEGDVELDLSGYFSTLVYGMYELRFTASGRMRVRIMYYELCLMLLV